MEDTIPFSVEAIINNSGYYFFPSYSAESDSVKFELASFFKRGPNDSMFHIQVKAIVERDGIALEKLESGVIQFIWVELPR